MSLLTRRGFTLVELMIAIVLLGIVSAALYKVLLNNQRTFAAQTQRIDLQQNIRAAATILPAEFRELDAADGDIRAMSATSITIRAMRQMAIICTAPVLPSGATMTFTVRQAPFFGNRQTFIAGDSILIFYDGNPGTRADDRWVLGAVTVAPTNLNCPDPTPPGPQPGFLVTAAPTWPAAPFNVAGAITAGAPVRGFSTVMYSLWQSPSDNQYYLAQTTSGSTQPLIGPLTGANGLSFVYYDSTGTTQTAALALVRMIEIRVRGRTAQVIRQANDPALAYKTDSVIARVALRNNIRCGGVALPAC
jgi:prepilin-type N-terminal cleavage/methylation domain-containing protein